MVLALALLAAHFFRWGALPVAVLCIASTVLLRVEAAWGRRVLQVVLVIGSMEWLRTLWVLVRARQESGDAWVRLVFILGAVVVATLVASIGAGRPVRRSKLQT